MEEQIAALLTTDRLRSYIGATGSVRDAVRLYEWDMRAAADVVELTGVVEVVVRNALDDQLRSWAAERRGQDSWFDVIPLDRRGTNDLATARSRAMRGTRRGEDPGRVVAELSFGFWRYLVESRYLTSLWTPALYRAFPHGDADVLTRQRDVRATMQQLHFVRNRAAHHEPIHGRHLARDLALAIELLGWVSPVAASWASTTTSLGGTIAERPATGVAAMARASTDHA
jgi:hypothetical protein